MTSHPAVPHRLMIGISLLVCCCHCQGGSVRDGDFGTLSSPTTGGTTGPTPPPQSGTPGFPQGPHSAALQIVKGSGSVITTPVLRVVSFNSDSLAPQYEDFGTRLAASSYWNDTTGEYGVGPLTAGPPVRETTTWAKSITDGIAGDGEPSDIETLLDSKLDGSAPSWGAPSSNDIYLLFIPQGIAVSPDNGRTPSACAAGILGWHTAMLLPQSQVTVSYVIIPDCGPLPNLSDIDSHTFSASHEVVESATDPQLGGFNDMDANHLVWQLAGGGPEVGAACVAQMYNNPGIFASPNDLPYTVQRTWSNAAAAGGHSPCLPIVKGEIFFDSVPVLTDAVHVALSSSPSVPMASTMGASVASGAQKVITLNLFSDGTTSGPWTVAATELGSQALTLTLDKSQGNNGDVVHLTVMVNSAPASKQEIVQISSTLGTTINNQFFVVQN